MASKSLSNFYQRSRSIVGLTPIGCYGKRCGCESGHIFECATCGYLRPWCRGADDGMADSALMAGKTVTRKMLEETMRITVAQGKKEMPPRLRRLLQKKLSQRREKKSSQAA